MKWKAYKTGLNDCLNDNKNYLVSFLNSDLKFSAGHRAYYDQVDQCFRSLENNNAHPLLVTIYCEIPDPNLDSKFKLKS